MGTVGDGGGDGEGDGMVGTLGDPKWWPPGLRFHPTDEELVLYYLKRKVHRRRIRLPMIGDLDVYKWEPSELPEKSALRSRDKQWYFFSPRDRKYPKGSRAKRTTRCGYWKTTGNDRTVSHKSLVVGIKKTLVYYQGRAPKGQRTDWLMYEYTLKEQGSCNNVQDSYALYKLFRKSGRGPKNGEQYGAPFREEEWNDDDDESRESMGIEDNWVGPVSDHLPSAADATVLGDDANALPTDGLDDLLLEMLSEQDMIQEHLAFPTCDTKVDVESEVGSHLLGLSYTEASSSKHGDDGWCEVDGIDTSFHIPLSASICMQPVETPELTSLINCSEQGYPARDEDFLEIKDFVDPQDPVWSMDNASQKDHIDDINEFYDPCDYFDPNMVLAEAMVSLDTMPPQSFFDGFNDDETQNHASYLTGELWTHEQHFNMSAAMEPEQIVMASPDSGVVFDNSLSNNGEDTRSLISHAGSSSESWFNSALSALLDSIPSRPAIASENALITRALERVSSFNLGQIGARQWTHTTTSGGAAVGRRQGGRNGGFLFISFLVGLRGIFWLLAFGAAVKVLKVLWGRFISS